MKRRLTFRTGCLAVLVLVSGCELDDPVAASWQENTSDTAWGIVYLTGYLFNGCIANRPVGDQDVTVPCSRGGSVHMTGRTDYDSGTGILSMDLTYEFDRAHASVAATNLVVVFRPLIGSIRQTGALRAGGGQFFEDQVARSTILAYNVTVFRAARETTEFADKGPYEVAFSISTNRLGELRRTVDGELDGCPFSWSYRVSGSGGGTNTSGVIVNL